MTARDKFIEAFTNAYLANEHSGRRVPVRTIAKWLGLTENTVRKHLNAEFDLCWRVSCERNGRFGWEWRPSVAHLAAMIRELRHPSSCPSDRPVGGQPK